MASFAFIFALRQKNATPKWPISSPLSQPINTASYLFVFLPEICNLRVGAGLVPVQPTHVVLPAALLTYLAFLAGLKGDGNS